MTPMWWEPSMFLTRVPSKGARTRYSCWMPLTAAMLCRQTSKQAQRVPRTALEVNAMSSRVTSTA